MAFVATDKTISAQLKSVTHSLHTANMHIFDPGLLWSPISHLICHGHRSKLDHHQVTLEGVQFCTRAHSYLDYALYVF